MRLYKPFPLFSYELKGYEEQVLKNYFPIIPKLNYPLRNTQEIVKFVQAKIDGKSRIDYYNHKHNVDNLKIPSNLTSTIEPREIFAKSFRDGLEKAIESIQELCGSNDRPTMFVINTTDQQSECGDCYNLDSPLKMIQTEKFIDGIYNKLGRQNTLIQDLYAMPTGLRFMDDQSHEIKKWLRNPKGKDVMVRLETMDGFTHDVIVVFQEDDPEKFEHNVCMRCTAILIVVYIPKIPHSKFCFCASCANCEQLTSQKCPNCTLPIYFCSKECFDGQQNWHEEECNNNKKYVLSESELFLLEFFNPIFNPLIPLQFDDEDNSSD